MTRRKRLLSLLLSVLMLCTLLPPRASAAPTLYFTAVNDRMCDLNDETMPFWQNGLLYVAGATVDGPDDLGIRYSYNQEKSVAILYKGQRVLYCDLTAGTMENNRTGEQYTGSPIVRSGMVFFPITALAKIFDLKYSSTKIAYGYLLRIRDDNAVLSDEYFIDAATDPIQKRYAQYERAHAAADFHGVHVERVGVRARGEPDILHAVFPVALRAATLFPLPGDAVLQPEIVLERQADDRARAPVAADVDRGVRLEQRQQQLDPCARKGGVVRVRCAPEAAAGEVLGQVVRRVHDQQVCKAARQVRRDRKRVAADGAAAHGVKRHVLRHAQAAREILRRILRQKVYGLVAFGFHGVTSRRENSFFAGIFRSLPWRRPCPRSADQTGSTF